MLHYLERQGFADAVWDLMRVRAEVREDGIYVSEIILAGNSAMS